MHLGKAVSAGVAADDAVAADKVEPAVTLDTAVPEPVGSSAAG